jgi:hypothetical protein
MTFEWSEYLNLARELAGKATAPANQEAKLRTASFHQSAKPLTG